MDSVKKYLLIFFTAVLLLAGFFVLAKTFFYSEIVIDAPFLPAFERIALSRQESPNQERAVGAASVSKQIDTPQEVRALYFTALSAGAKGFAERVIKIASTTDVNAVVIDLKDMQGRVAYDSQLEQVKNYSSKKAVIKEIDKLIEALHNHNIYLIGRLAVFQDNALASSRPDLAVLSRQALPVDFEEKEPESSWFWLDNMGLFWLDPFSIEIARYNAAIAQEALFLGFDEINFDYIRFPSDGDLKDIYYPFYSTSTPKNLIIKNFFETVRQELPEAKLSADIFAFSLVRNNDLGVGQQLEDILLYFDYVCPMVYPSHFSLGFLGYPEPAREPYQVVKRTIELGRERRLALQDKIEAASCSAASSTVPFAQSSERALGQFRPWLQDFSLAVSYSEKEVKEQIEGVKEALEDDFVGFMLWNAANLYTKSALVSTTSDAGN